MLDGRPSETPMGFKLFILVTATVAFMRTGGEVVQPFTWWATHPLAKIRPLDAVPNVLAKSVDLYAGRNEFGSFQIVLRAGSTELSGVDVDFSDFRTRQGAEISKENVTIYLERFLNLQRPSMYNGGTGLWMGRDLCSTNHQPWQVHRICPHFH
jgi:hypothetical protein